MAKRKSDADTVMVRGVGPLPRDTAALLAQAGELVIGGKLVTSDDIEGTNTPDAQAETAETPEEGTDAAGKAPTAEKVAAVGDALTGAK